MIAIALAVALLAGQAADGGSANHAAAPEPGQTQDWERSVPLMPGDQYGTVILSIDRKGRPLECGLKDTNIKDREQIYNICQAFEQQWHTQPLMKDGVATAGTVERHLVMRGREGSRAVDAAWARYKAAHPEAVRPN